MKSISALTAGFFGRIDQLDDKLTGELVREFIGVVDCMIDRLSDWRIGSRMGGLKNATLTPAEEKNKDIAFRRHVYCCLFPLTSTREREKAEARAVNNSPLVQTAHKYP